MKDIIKYYLQLIVLMFCLFTSACSDDDETVTPVFPDLQKIECAVGDTKTLTFEATDNWILISSSLWCYFEQDGEQTFTCSGGVGEQTVTIHISDDATELMKSYKAELTMTMAGSRQVIAEVTRPSTGYELHAFDAEQTIEYTAENPYVQDYGGKAYFWVSSNADWIVESSESLDLSKTNISGEAGNNVKITPLLKQGTENRKTAWTQELIFKNRKGEVISKLPVHYDGIPADKIEFSNDNIYSNKIKASVDGESYTFKNQSYEAEGVPLTVIARNDEYTYVCVEYTSTMGPETGWNEEWKDKVFSKMKENENTQYIFLTKRPENIKLKETPDNGWFGVTVTSSKEKTRIDYLRNNIKAKHYHITFEPMFDDVGKLDLSNISWIVIGTETGNRKGKISSKREWVFNIYNQAKEKNIPVFMKEDLLGILNENEFVQEFPKEFGGIK